jgi:5,10-methylenetetrahydromethanopterin reductase
MAELTIGTTLQGVDPPDQFTEYVRRIEEWGYDYFWITDSSLHARYCYSYLTLAAVNSSRMRLGTNCTHPHTRHPALNANAIATVNEISGGRTILGIGAGDSPVQELGYPLAKVRELEAMVEFSRRLYSGNRFDYEGPHFKLHGGSIHYGLDGVDPPKIYLTVSGPRMLELAGRVADGVTIHCGAFREGLEFALAHLKNGADAAGRSLDDIDIAWHLFGVLDDDVEAAQDSARPMAAWFPKRSPLYCKIAGVPDELIEEIRTAYSGGEFHEAKRAHELTTNEMVDKLTVAGGATVWLERIAMAQDLGVSHIELFPLGDRMDLLEKISTGVIRTLRT